METTHWLLLLILIVPLVFVFLGRLRMDLAALIMAVSLGILQLAGFGIIGPANTPQDANKVLSGFSQNVVITLISLFILTKGLEKSGVTGWIAKQILRIGGTKTSRLILLFTTATALLSLFMNNLAAGALMLPGAMEVSRRTKIKPSKLLIPVAYGSLLGGSATYFTTANIVMSDLLKIANPPQAPLHFLDFTPTGGLIALVGILFLWLIGDRLLPDREPANEQKIVRRTNQELEDFYQIGERLWLGKLAANSPFIGLPLSETNIGQKYGVTVAAIQHDKEKVVLAASDQRLQARDQLIIIGREEKIRSLETVGISVLAADDPQNLFPRDLGLSEMILAPQSSWEGKTLKEINLRQFFGVTVIALKRRIRSYRTDVGDLPLEMGDSLLAIGNPEDIKHLHRNSNVIILEADAGDQPIHTTKAWVTAAITFAAIGVSIAGVPVFLCMLSAAVLILVTKIVSVDEAYRSVEWQAVFLIAGMYVVSLAMVQTGLAQLLGNRFLSLVTPMGALGVAGGAYLLSGLLTQVMGGQVSALVVGPIVISAAISIGANPQAVALATAIGCSASFLTPMAHPVNILMIAPANYKFSDFFRAGWMLTLLSFVTLLAGLLLFWRV